tara:strand:- start:9237 stop:9953 length:717 start_codon:yes stop_codon:yes gene_type:complete
MDTASITSLTPVLDEIDKWKELLPLLPLLISLELILSADNAVALASLTRNLQDLKLRSRALDIGIIISLFFRICLIIFSQKLLYYWQIKLLAGIYLIYLFITKFLSSLSENRPNKDKINSSLSPYLFIKVVVLLALTDLAFSIDSITAAVAISDQYLLVITGAIIGVIALRFTSGIFLKLLSLFSNLEMAGYIAILLIGIKLVLGIILSSFLIPENYFYVAILLAFIWGFSKRQKQPI